MASPEINCTFTWFKMGVPLFGTASAYGTGVFMGNTDSIKLLLCIYSVTWFFWKGSGVCRVSGQAGKSVSSEWTGPGLEHPGSRDGWQSLPASFLLLERGCQLLLTSWRHPWLAWW